MLKIKKQKLVKQILIWLSICSIIIIAFILICSNYINSKSHEYITDNIYTIKPAKVGLVLGTSQFLSAKKHNQFFTFRMDAAVNLYNAGKIKYILVSGDNHLAGYNEPELMRKELIKRGIPKDKIYMDFAGFRTFDSVIRCHEVFGQSTFIIISQKFHNQRAVFIGKYLHLDVIGFNAQDVELNASFKTLVREYFARVKVFIDILSGVQPKFLGSKITIGQDSTKVTKN